MVNFRSYLVSFVRLVKTATRINVIYFRPKDALASVTIIYPANQKVDEREYHIVVTNDDTTMSAFECATQNGGTIMCIFASNGPSVYRIEFVEDPAAGLVQKTKQTYQLYDDNYGIKVVFNMNYFVILALSHKTGLPRLLIYKNQDKMGSNTLWSGINYDEHTDRPPVDLDMVLLESDALIFNTNFLGPADARNPSIAKQC